MAWTLLLSYVCEKVVQSHDLRAEERVGSLIPDLCGFAEAVTLHASRVCTCLVASFQNLADDKTR